MSDCHKLKLPLTYTTVSINIINKIINYKLKIFTSIFTYTKNWLVFFFFLIIKSYNYERMS